MTYIFFYFVVLIVLLVLIYQFYQDNYCKSFFSLKRDTLIFIFSVLILVTVMSWGFVKLKELEIRALNIENRP